MTKINEILIPKNKKELSSINIYDIAFLDILGKKTFGVIFKTLPFHKKLFIKFILSLHNGFFYVYSIFFTMVVIFFIVMFELDKIIIFYVLGIELFIIFVSNVSFISKIRKIDKNFLNGR